MPGNNNLPSSLTMLRHLLLIILITFSSLIFFSVLSIFLSGLIFGTGLSDLADGTAKESINALRLTQALTMLGTFGLSALILMHFIFRQPFTFLRLNRFPQLPVVFIILLLFFISVPAIEWMISVNENLTFPDFLSYFEDFLQHLELKMTDQIILLTTINTPFELIVVIVIVALIPALCEELFFRGFLQQFFLSIISNKHIAILLTAFIFSAIHFQFYGFLPRFALGLILGYLFYLSGNLWTSIIFHFTNNLVNVLYLYTTKKNISNEETRLFMNESNIFIILSFAITAALFLFLAHYYSKKRKNKETWVSVFSTFNMSEAEIIRGKLENENINAVVINKRDSVYPSHGEIEVMVNKELEEQAKEIIGGKEE